ATSARLHPPDLAGPFARPGPRRRDHRVQPRVTRRPGGGRALRLRRRPVAPIPGQAEHLRRARAGPAAAPMGTDPGTSGHGGRGPGTGCGGRGGRGWRRRGDLPRGHHHQGARPMAHARADRCGAAVAGDRRTGGARSFLGGPAHLRRSCRQATPAPTHPGHGSGRAAAGSVGLSACGAQQRHPAQDHGHGHEPAAGDARGGPGGAGATAVEPGRAEGRWLMRVALLGAGSWGTAYAKVLADAGNEVTIWARREEVAAAIRQYGTNPDYLPSVRLPERVTATSDPEEALKDGELVVFALPAQTLRSNLTALRDSLPPDATL